MSIMLKKRGIKVFNTPGAFTNGVSTLALTMLLSFFRKDHSKP